ncbi:MAG: DDE-type integrase/transposase/recombinase [Dactylosporangium sp.]|nr:DDE-type integrase/transposase/recombinase [Dactylosporangium sp.]NNJ63490.1 DDE-type integrase/transposase/recombinase [Dactylosporangium sp.]
MTLRMVLRPGDRVHFDGREYQVAGLAGTSVRLRSEEVGADQVVLAGHLMASPDFTLVGAGPAPQVEPFGLLDALPADVLAAAKQWECHIVEVETGLEPHPPPDAIPKPEYDPARHSLAERQRTKGAELGVSYRTVENRRLRYAAQGLWGLVDQRAVRPWEMTGRADARLVEAVREIIAEQTDASTGTRSRLIRRVVKRVEQIHGPGVVPLPGRTAFYELVDRLSQGRHTFGSAVTRRQMANRPAGLFTPTFASRPGEQVQIDSTPIDVMVILDDGLPVRADMTLAVDVATRTICAGVLRPVGTKAVDAALLLAKMLVPEPMRPGWANALRLSASRMPHARLVDIDTRMREAAARPVIVPDQIVIDHGRVFVSETFIRACDRLGISVQACRPGTPTDKGVVEATNASVKTLFAQHVAGYTGGNPTMRGRDVTGEWTIGELQDLLDEWLICWQHRPHDDLRDPYQPRRVLTPNEKYAALVAVAGYLPLILSGEDYLELLPVEWRRITDEGITINNRTYNDVALGPYRNDRSGIVAKGNRWEVHVDPYDVSQVHLRTRDGWITVPWIYLPMVSAPFADFTWRHARRLAGNGATEAEIARVLDDLLTRAEHGPDRAGARITARTRAGQAAHRPPLPEPDPGPVAEEVTEPDAEVIPFGIFDADAEAERWI